MEHSNDFLGTERVGRLMGRYAVPCVISLLVGALYNIVDQIFIANADYLGSYGNAANTVVFPLTVVALAIAVMVGDGCCAFVSMALGRSDRQRACRSVGNAVVLTVAASLVLTAVYLIFADGSPRFAMISTLAGAVLNIILDPVFGQEQYAQIPMAAVGKALASTMLSMFREVVFGVGFALLLPVFLGLDGVLWSMPVSDVLTFVISAVIIVKTYRDLDAPALRAR